jgi:hypothetical protein
LLACEPFSLSSPFSRRHYFFRCSSFLIRLRRCQIDFHFIDVSFFA